MAAGGMNRGRICACPPLEIDEYASDEKRMPGEGSGTERSKWR